LEVEEAIRGLKIGKVVGPSGPNVSETSTKARNDVSHTRVQYNTVVHRQYFHQYGSICNWNFIL
jgi:hypothetical protein